MNMKRILKNILLLNTGILISTVNYAQNINIASGLNEVQGQVDSLFTGVLNLAMSLCGIGAVIGLVIAAWKLYTDEHGQGWKTALTWFGILALICIGLYVIKAIFI